MKTIAAISTPLSTGGVAMVRISGKNAIQIAERVFVPYAKPLHQKKGYTAAFGEITEGGEKFDQGVALLYRAPKSYTGEDVVEICCHGGIFLAKKLLRAVVAQGAQIAEPGEFSKRAFLNGKMDLAQAEAVSNLVYAKTENALRAASDVLQGELSREIAEVRKEINLIVAEIQALIDYPEEEVSQAQESDFKEKIKAQEKRLTGLYQRYDQGRLLREGVRTVLIGKPNVGKSTLMNLLSGFEKSIVTDVAGTTRDLVEEQVDIGGVVLRLCDTAGIHHTEDKVERIGVDRAKEGLASADLVLLVLDFAQALAPEDILLMNLLKDKPCIAVMHKTDLTQKLQVEEVKQRFAHWVFTSKANQLGLTQLKEEIFRVTQMQDFDLDAPMLGSERQRVCVKEALEEINSALSAPTLDIVSICLESALDALLRLTGQTAQETVLEEIFSRFCVGK